MLNMCPPLFSVVDNIEHVTYGEEVQKALSAPRRSLTPAYKKVTSIAAIEGKVSVPDLN